MGDYAGQDEAERVDYDVIIWLRLMERFEFVSSRDNDGDVAADDGHVR